MFVSADTTALKYYIESEKCSKHYDVPSWLSPVERLAVNQSVKGPNPFDGANSFLFSRESSFSSKQSFGEFFAELKTCIENVFLI